MLWQQGWKLSSGHDAITSGVLKAKYYPKGVFLEYAAFAKTTLRTHGTALWAAPMYRTSGYKHVCGIAFWVLLKMCYIGLEILAFPCNQFGEQEPESNDKIVDFVCTRFKSEFPIFDKIEVNGGNSAPLYKFLKSGKWGIFGDDIQWNFAKFVVDKKGHVVGRYYPTTSPLSLERDIRQLLGIS
ncbi:probable glutathione peroxidase 8 [Vigna umbellata]|uniref:probable glutathione peroxidase 8 n=1 Tax=Vigna umbellata TaxID=87088 RepID=UPI001F5F5D4B|nr:probable glutathione peroxidase 8 [Vigna umbellata]